MKVSVLESGSKENTSLIVTGQHKILMDARLSGNKTKDLLADVGVDINDIDMAFLSHDHTDHRSLKSCQGPRQLGQRGGVPY